MKTLITPGMTKLPNTIYIHADIVKECMRLFAKDTLWHKAIQQNAEFARKFQLDTLILSNDQNISKIGVNMGSLIMLKVPNLELSDVVSDDFSMEKISQALVKYVLTTMAKQKRNYDEEIDALSLRCDQNKETGRNLQN